MRPSLVIGLTGGIGCGKTTAAQYFAELGIPLIDADVIARNLVQPGTTPLDHIRAHFGRSILKEDGTLNREMLRNIIFTKPEEKIWLEQLLHPHIFKQIEIELAGIKTDYCIVIIPLLLELKCQHLVDRILVIDCDETIQKQRVMERDQTQDLVIDQILKSQISRSERLAQADDVIYNQESLTELRAQIRKLHRNYLKLALKKP